MRSLVRLLTKLFSRLVELIDRHEWLAWLATAYVIGVLAWLVWWIISRQCY